MIDEDFQHLVNQSYQAFGRYMVEFSRLMFHMRSLVVNRLQTDPPILAELVLGETHADEISAAFFGACRALAELDKEEAKTASRLRKRVRDEIEWRNDLAHGDWFVNLARLGIVPLGTAQIVRIRPMRAEGVIKTIDLSAEQLDARSDSLNALREIVVEFGAICLGLGYEGTRVSDILILRSGKVLREGPKASTTPYSAT